MGEGGPIEVKRRRHTPEQIIRKRREAERMLAEGRQIPEVAKALEVPDLTFDRWRNQYGGMKANDAKELPRAAARECDPEADGRRQGARERGLEGDREGSF